jgi:hypothetical protein
MAAHTCNLNYLGDRDRRIRPSPGKSKRPYLEKKIKRNWVMAKVVEHLA